MKLFTKQNFYDQFLPIGLTFVVCAVLMALIFLEILLLNKTTPACIRGESCIVPSIHIQDVLVGMTIYLKTSVDFAIFIGNLMHSYPTWKSRIAIEIGTATGNALGTMVILAIWNYFRDIRILLAAMILLAALVLFKLAEEGLEHTHTSGYSLPNWFYTLTDLFEAVLYRINSVTAPVLRRIIPNLSMLPKAGLTVVGLFAMSFTIPFILGLDDFAGYVPVFNIVNVFGFSCGVLLGHMLLNIFLFISPTATIKIVRNPIISFLGSVAFVLLALWGLYEVFRLVVVRG